MCLADFQSANSPTESSDDERKAYGYRSFRIAELSLYHVLGKLPEPQLAHRFF